MRTFHSVSPNRQVGSITVVKSEFRLFIRDGVFRIERPVLESKPIFICVYKDDVVEAIRELALSPYYVMDIREHDSDSGKKDLIFSLTNSGQFLNLALDTGYASPIQIFDIPYWHFRSVVFKMLGDEKEMVRENNRENDELIIEER